MSKDTIFSGKFIYILWAHICGYFVLVKKKYNKHNILQPIWRCNIFSNWFAFSFSYCRGKGCVKHRVRFCKWKDVYCSDELCARMLSIKFSFYVFDFRSIRIRDIGEWPLFARHCRIVSDKGSTFSTVFLCKRKCSNQLQSINQIMFNLHIIDAVQLPTSTSYLSIVRLHHTNG